ncbi:hypothetical protein Tco_0328308 [Tanacetum coccineum]
MRSLNATLPLDEELVRLLGKGRLLLVPIERILIVRLKKFLLKQVRLLVTLLLPLVVDNDPDIHGKPGPSAKEWKRATDVIGVVTHNVTITSESNFVEIRHPLYIWRKGNPEDKAQAD